MFYTIKTLRPRKMNLIFLLLIFSFLSITSCATFKCEEYNFKPVLYPKDCRCKNITHSPIGRIYNGDTLDSRDLLYVAAIFVARVPILFDKPIHTVFHLICSGTILNPNFVLT